MTSIVISRKALVYDLVDVQDKPLTFEMWFNLLPEVQERIQIEPGQRRIVIACKAKNYITSIGIFSEKTGGNLIEKGQLVYPRPPMLVYMGDDLVLDMDWTDF